VEELEARLERMLEEKRLAPLLDDGNQKDSSH
jgi:hypothetical protein